MDPVPYYGVYTLVNGGSQLKPMTIGQVAKKTGVGVETIRFYERLGLVDEPPRLKSGYRQYSEGVIARIQFIKRAKELGFSLKEIDELFSLRVDHDASCGDVRSRAEVKIAETQEKIKELQRIKKALTKLATSCTGGGPTSDCPILDALEGKHLSRKGHG